MTFLRESFFRSFQFGFVIFGQKDFGSKAAHKILVKLTPDHPGGDERGQPQCRRRERPRRKPRPVGDPSSKETVAHRRSRGESINLIDFCKDVIRASR
jgi:hypothetical protein